MKPLRMISAAVPAILLILSACDQVPVSGDADDRIAARGIKSCERAVRNHTGNDAAAHNPGIPVVEVNQYVVDVANDARWLCYTDDAGSAEALVPLSDTL